MYVESLERDRYYSKYSPTHRLRDFQKFWPVSNNKIASQQVTISQLNSNTR